MSVRLTDFVRRGFAASAKIADWGVWREFAGNAKDCRVSRLA
jgi:hypothetical protein